MEEREKIHPPSALRAFKPNIIHFPQERKRKREGERGREEGKQEGRK